MFEIYRTTYYNNTVECLLFTSTLYQEKVSLFV